jgi:hypothetical protein
LKQAYDYWQNQPDLNCIQNFVGKKLEIKSQTKFQQKNETIEGSFSWKLFVLFLSREKKAFTIKK